MRLISLLLLFAIVFSVGFAHGHDLGLAQVQILEKPFSRYELRAKLPDSLKATSPVLPDSCELLDQSRHPADSRNSWVEWQYQCDSAMKADDQILLEWDREAALVVSVSIDGITRSKLYPAEQGDVSIPVGELYGAGKSALAISKQYFLFGMEHILSGLDHLVFLAALLLIAGGWQLVKLVTAFTVGHSMTLIAATLGWVNVPAPPVEVCIALSIVFLAREAFLFEHEKTAHGFGLVLMFGLLHGLGFASALTDIGLDANSLVFGLLAFNIGVEIGQLIFLGLAFSLIRILLGTVQIPESYIRSPAFLLGSFGAFWVVQRSVSFVY